MLLACIGTGGARLCIARFAMPGAALGVLAELPASDSGAVPII
jgi:hypothetical protein